MPVTSDTCPALRETIERYTEDRNLLRRTYGLPLSEPDLAVHREFLETCREALAEVAFDALGVDDRIDYLMYRTLLDDEVRRLDREAQRDRAAAEALLPFAEPIVELARHRRAVERPDHAAVAGALVDLAEAVETQTEAVRDDLDAGEDPAEGAVVLRAANLAGRLKGVLAEWHGFFDGYDPLFTWWAAEPYAKADEALEGYVKLLREEVLGLKDDEPDGPLIGQPVGAETLREELERSYLPYDPERLIELGEAERAWCMDELRRAAADMGLGEDWRAAVEQVKTAHVAPGEQPYLIKSLAEEATAYVETHDLVTVPAACRDAWRMIMMTPERQAITPFFTGGEEISVSFPTAGMAYEAKQMSLRGNNPAFARATVHHELIPGHHLHLYMLTRERPYRRAFRTAFSIEGWTLHWEMLLWERAFARTAEERVGMLFWRLHRCARVTFSLRYHLGEWSADECVAFLVDEIGHEPANARAEVRRTIGPSYEPLYQCAYLIGGMQVHALYHELVTDGDWTPKQFHDNYLGQNAVPNELIRASMRGDLLGEDHQASWRWAD